MTVAQSYVRGIIPDSENRQKDDFYPTPREGTEALLAVEKFDGPIWEPACGDGAICKPLIDAGYDVVASDLVDRGYGQTGVDFLMEWQPRAPNIITNPPFKMAQEFALKSLDLTTGKVAMLLRLAWLEGIERRDTIFRATPLARVHIFSKRLAILRNGEAWEGGGGGMIAFAWFVWEHGYTDQPRLNWL